MSKLVGLQGVGMDYRRGRETIQVLRAIDLEVDEGEFVALMGPSGSGKTTLLHLIGGLDRPTTGRVTVAGSRLDALDSRALAAWRAATIGFVFQFYHLMPMLSARENVELPLLLTRLGTAERRRRAEIALELVGLADRAAHRPSELSGGQQQRVAIARAIVSDPLLLVCDEPTGDLDRQSADEILDLLGLLHEQHGKTIVMVTHDPQAARAAGRVLHLDKGAIVASAAERA